MTIWRGRNGVWEREGMEDSSVLSGNVLSKIQKLSRDPGLYCFLPPMERAGDDNPGSMCLVLS